MSRSPRGTRSHTFLIVVLVLMAGAARGESSSSESSSSESSSSDSPLIRRTEPDPGRQARSAAWLADFAVQQPALSLAVVQLERQQERWRLDSGVERCRRARQALARVDRGVLLAVAEYQLLSAIGEGLDELDAAIRACSKRRYFELDYRLKRARRSLTRARDTARTQARR